jgi:hypothetical protein
MVALLVGSVFGIFFSGEDSGNGYTMPMAIAEINQEYADKVKEIRDGNAHDEVQMSGSRARGRRFWRYTPLRSTPTRTQHKTWRRWTRARRNCCARSFGT